MEIGLRVVRGPDWKWADQDNGEGHVGTVVELGRSGSDTCPDKTVVVLWDGGQRTNYRVGYEEAFDLRIYDNAPIGMKHPNIVCDSCKKPGISGMRWKCLVCHDFDLCSICYFADAHDLTHPFRRFDKASEKGVKVCKRLGCEKVEVKGIFKGAKVIRGLDWDWGDQDGGESKVGKVLDVRGWDLESDRSVANVIWSTGMTNVYRIGHKGKVDLKYVNVGSGGTYYKDQLPVLGCFHKADLADTTPVASPFKVGDKVRCDLDSDVLKVMQEGHGGWNPKMAEYIKKLGTVHRITERGDIRVQFEGCGNRWTFHPESLVEVHEFSAGDTVRISDSISFVKEHQKAHGEWIETMRTTLGQVGQIIQVYGDGDVRVLITNKEWTFNPECCKLIPHGAQELNNTLSSHDRDEYRNGLRQVRDKFMDMHMHDSGPERLVREAAQGHLDIVADIVKKFPDKVDQKSSGKTALQVASHQGHYDVVSVLLSAKADISQIDDDGDTALHYSAFGNKPEIMELLLQKKADINAINNGGCTALHVSVNKQHSSCVGVLLKYHCNINLQDTYGDTALHDAISKESLEIMEKLINHPSTDFMCKNIRGFNVLHHAALKGNTFATESILHKCRQITDIRKDDGFAALHLAALNGHKDVVNSLLTLGHGDIDIRNNRQQTPLLLAVSQGHSSLIELLITKGSKVFVEDEDGDTCLHLTLMRQVVATDTDCSPALDSIRSHLNLTAEGIEQGVAIACYLVQQGASLTHKNHNNKTPIDLVSDPQVIQIIQQFAVSASGLAPEITTSPFPDADVECIVCYEHIANVTFQPCGHTMVCTNCCVKMKRCLKCRQSIESKLGPGGDHLVSLDSPLPSSSLVPNQNLQQRLQEIEEQFLCSICMERRRNMAFLCGHSVCSVCGDALKVCHMCRKSITKRINLW